MYHTYNKNRMIIELCVDWKYIIYVQLQLILLNISVANILNRYVCRYKYTMRCTQPIPPHKWIWLLKGCRHFLNTTVIPLLANPQVKIQPPAPYYRHLNTLFLYNKGILLLDIFFFCFYHPMSMHYHRFNQQMYKIRLKYVRNLRLII
jgi:hypothetical protein